MLFSKDLLFIHIPKTGGMSVTQLLLDLLPPPVYYSHPGHDAALDERGIVQLAGARHETLAQAATVVRRCGFDLQSFPMILAVVRNPYSLEVSRYAYLQAGHAWDRGENQELAMLHDFETFARRSTYHDGPERPMESYFLLDGRLPSNLRLVRFEHLRDEVVAIINSLGLKAPEDFPWENRSKHGDFRTYFTSAAEAAVRRKYRWLFDHGYYEPMIVTEADEIAYRGRRELPLCGPVVQYGPLSGYWPDGWAEDCFRFTVLPTAATRSMEIRGALPDSLGTSVHLTVDVAGARSQKFVDGGKPFSWTIETAGRLEPMHVVVRSATFWCPASSGESSDRRRLAFRLREIGFEPA